MDNHEKHMARAIELSVQNIKKGGSPFGAVIVRNGEVIAEGFNQVIFNSDPTAHAEVTAIRNAAKKLQTFDLTGCIIYTSCEPCPMCLGAIYWARISEIFFGNTKHDAETIGFSDNFIYQEIEKPLHKRTLSSNQIMKKEAFTAFKLWKENDDKIVY